MSSGFNQYGSTASASFHGHDNDIRLQNASSTSATFNGNYNDVQYQYVYAPQQNPSLQDDLEKRLRPMVMDASRRRECLSTTRKEGIDHVVDWVHSKGRGKKVLCLRGLAGSGKSTISTSVAGALRRRGHLGAFLFFERDNDRDMDPSSVVRTMSFQLGLNYPGIGTEILANIEKYPDVSHHTLDSQLENLIIQPLSSFRSANPDIPIVFVLDALDEYGKSEKREPLLRALFHRSFLSNLDALFFITSRPEADIVAYLKGVDNYTFVTDLALDTPGNRRDIDIYLETEMRNIGQLAGLEYDWPGKVALHQLAKKACGLFVWASTAIKFIKGHHLRPELRLEIILQGAPAQQAEEALDNLYQTALDWAGPEGCWENPDFVAEFRRVMGTILVAYYPLARGDVDSLLKYPKNNSCSSLISQLGCVIDIGSVPRLLHPSFADFLYSRMRCGRDIWHFDESSLHYYFSIRCMENMAEHLTENVLDLPIALDRDSEMVVLKSEATEYACWYWGYHVCSIRNEVQLISEHLDKFLSKHLLHWIEAMCVTMEQKENVFDRRPGTAVVLKNILSWISTHSGSSPKLVALVQNALRFFDYFADAIEVNPLGVYFAALPFAPSKSIVHGQFHRDSKYPTVVGGLERYWPPLLRTLKRYYTNSQLFSSLPLALQPTDFCPVAFSQDGSRVVSILDKTRLAVWNIKHELKSRGHIDNIWSVADNVVSVAFSPDGSKVICGSERESVVRVWDVTSDVRHPPIILRGHTAAVYSVASSPDGSTIVSGSMDRTIRVWKANSGVQVLEGHTDVVYSVAVSPDGSRIVSGSKDQTIRLWDLNTGTPIPFQCEGRIGEVWSVAFSPDSVLIVTTSMDKTLRVLDANSGARVVSPLRGSFYRFWSAKFSPARNLPSGVRYRIIAGCEDHTILRWNITTGGQLQELPPLTGHTDEVTAVAISPDGTLIASRSRESLRLWDATSPVEAPRDHGQLPTLFDASRSVIRHEPQYRAWDEWGCVLVPLRRPQDSVRQLSFAEDGSRVASVSFDQTVRIWDVDTGQQTIHPIQGTVLHVDPATRLPVRIFQEWNATTGARVVAPRLDEDDENEVQRGIAFSHDRFRVRLVSTDKDTIQNRPWHLKQTPFIPVKCLEGSWEQDLEVTDEWVLDLKTNCCISSIPFHYFCHSVHGRKVAFGTEDGVVIMRFPLTGDEWLDEDCWGPRYRWPRTGFVREPED